MAKVVYEIKLWPSKDFTPETGVLIPAKCVVAETSIEGLISAGNVRCGKSF